MLSLAEVKRKKREAQRQLELLTCRINHIENKEKEHSQRATCHGLLLEQRFRTRLTALELKRMLKESREQRQAEQFSKTLEVRRQKQQLRQGRELALAVTHEHKKRASAQVRTASQMNQTCFGEMLRADFQGRKQAWQAMRRSNGLALFRRRMRDNYNKTRLDDQRRREALALEREAAALELTLGSLY